MSDTDPEPVAWSYEMTNTHMDNWLETVDSIHPEEAFAEVDEGHDFKFRNIIPLVPAEEGRYE